MIPKCYYILIAVNIFVAILEYCYLAEKLVNKKSVGKLSFSFDLYHNEFRAMIIPDTEGISRHIKRYRRIIPYPGRGIRSNACFGVILK